MFAHLQPSTGHGVQLVSIPSVSCARMGETCGKEPMQPSRSPFLKWAGGKRWLVGERVHNFPARYERYIEPFLGSGAVFFALQPKSAILADTNRQLVETYIAIQQDWRKLVSLLRKHHRMHTKAHYYAVRRSMPRTMHVRAARLLYLNRTCWNGLFRVNKRGQFNVPIGTKKNVLLKTDDFEYVHKLLRNVILECSDFEPIIDSARKGDLVFVDPPYTVKHNHNGFTKYNEKLFSWQDQVRLRDCLIRAKERGALIVATNANNRSVRKLYLQGFKVRSVQRLSVIAADSRRRGKSTELLIKS